MVNSFDPQAQKVDLESKLVLGLERLSEVFRVLLWEKAKETGLSPIQIQFLLFIQTHDASLSSVSNLSKEFHLKKPTVSDAIKSLFAKGLVDKVPGTDARAYTLRLTKQGRAMVKQLEGFETPLKKGIRTLAGAQRMSLYESLNQLIFGLHQSGVIEVQRMCLGCRFHEEHAEGHYCQFIKRPLRKDQLRLDCTDYEIALKA